MTQTHSSLQQLLKVLQLSSMQSTCSTSWHDMADGEAGVFCYATVAYSLYVYLSDTSTWQRLLSSQRLNPSFVPEANCCFMMSVSNTQ